MPRLRESDSVPDPELMAYVDGALPPAEMARIETRLLAEPDLRIRVESWSRQRDLIGKAASAADDLPENLRIVALQRELERRLKARRWRAMLLGPRLRQVAASVAIFAAGWGANVIATGTDRATSAHPGYVDLALNAHHAALHSSASPSYFRGEQIETAVAWMSEQMQLQLESPRLDRLGYEVMSAQLDTAGPYPIAHFVYRNPQDEMVTVSVSPHPDGVPAHAMRVSRAGSQAMVYWSEGPFDYTVVAAADPGRLTTLAAAVRN